MRIWLFMHPVKIPECIVDEGYFVSLLLPYALFYLEDLPSSNIIVLGETWFGCL